MGDAETIIVTCTCGQRMKAPVSAVGKSAACVKCGEKVKIRREDDVSGDGADASSGGGDAPEKAAKKPKKKAAIVQAGASVLETLKQNGVVTDEGIAEAELLRKDLPFADWEALIECGAVSQDDFSRVMTATNVARIDLNNYNIPTDVVDYVPEELVKKGRLFPVDKLGKMLTIAMACPLDTAIIEEVAAATGYKIKVMLAPLNDLRKVMDYYYPVIRGHAAYDDAFTKELDKEFKEIAGANHVCASIFDAEPLAPNQDTVNKLQSMSQDTLENIRNVVAQDPVTALLILSAANSAAYGFPRRVDNVALAAAVMGGPALVAATRAVPSEDYFSNNGGLDRAALWKRAVVCAKASEAVSELQQNQRGLTAYTAGLVHGVGRLAMEAILPNSYAKLTEGLVGRELIEKEERLFRVSHPEVGYMVARKLNLPAGITEPVRHYRHFEEATKSTEVTAAVALGAIIADAIESGGKANLDRESTLMDKLSMTPKQVSEIQAAVG